MHLQTVLGPVAPEVIGPTDSHEHLFIRGGIPVLQYPDFLLSDYVKIANEAALFKAAGGSAIVEMSPIDWGRDATQLVRLARATGLHIIAATGFHKVTYYSDIHWIHAYSEEDIVQLICDELEIGMDLHNYNGPLVSRTSARAGVIKVGTRRQQFSDTERKLLRAAAAAHLRTGAPIITHTDEGELALEQITFLCEHGVKAHRIAISHMDRRIDVPYHKEVASTGAFVEYDALTRLTKNFDKSTRRLVIEMVSAGFAGNILLGGDISRQGYWRNYGGTPGLDFLVSGFKSALVEEGLPSDAIEAIYVRNPRLLLTWSNGVSAGSPVTSAGDLGAGASGENRDVDRWRGSAAAIATARDSSMSEFPHKRLRAVGDLVSQGLVARQDASVLERVVEMFSLGITPDLTSLVGTAPDDPIARQFVPKEAELDIDEREIADPIGDRAYQRTKGLIHRYPDRVLLKPTPFCPVYCRFCFRREEVGRRAEQVTEIELREAVTYIREHRDIWEVILTGGDPLILSDRRLRSVFTALHDIEHLEVIRIHTRYPVADPQRITEDLVRAVRGRAAVYAVLHCNHPRELTADAVAACGRLINNGIPMLAQTVLLRGVNDDAGTLTALMRALVRARIKPYYLHHLDLARGTGHFRTTVAKGQELMQRLRGTVSGLCQPCYVLDIPGGYGKVPIGPVYIRPTSSAAHYIVEDYQGRQHSYMDLGEIST